MAILIPVTAKGDGDGTYFEYVRLPGIKDVPMKHVVLIAAPLLFVSACSQPDSNGTNAQAPDAAAINKSQPHDSSKATKHDKPMGMAMMSPAAGDSEATRGSKAAMMKMMHGMPAYTGDADVDFNTQMRGHHVAAIEMAEVQLTHGKDPASRALAQEIIAAQKKEIGRTDRWLAKRGQ